MAQKVETLYHVYSNATSGDLIDYGTPVATVSANTWTSPSLAAPGTWRFGIRAFNDNGEEQNLDCAVAITLDTNGNDITNRPLPPTGLRGFALAGGVIRVEWYYAITAHSRAPSGFHVYIGTAGEPSYASPVATAFYSTGFFNTFQVDLTGLTDATVYTIGVRAYNASGVEQNTTVVTVTADATGPATVDSLIAVAIV